MIRFSSVTPSHAAYLMCLDLPVSDGGNGPARLGIMDKGSRAMIRRTVSLTIVMGTVVVTMMGCEEFRRATRKHDDRVASIESDTTKIQAVDADPKNPKPFFSNNRLAGGWSSEAREIESHLGVGP